MFQTLWYVKKPLGVKRLTGSMVTNDIHVDVGLLPLLPCFYVLLFHYVLRLSLSIGLQRRSVAGVSPQKHAFDPGPVYLRFVVDKVALGQFLPQYFCLPLSVPSHQRSMLLFILILFFQ
jgi:hypothetical protein